MKRKRQLIIGLVLALVVTSGFYAFAYTATTATMGVTVAGEAIATAEEAATQPDWNSILTPVGDTETLRPNATGTYSQCDPIGAFPNYACVDEVTADEDSTYVNTSGGATEIDTYNIANHSEGTGTINSVTVYIRTRVTTSGHAAEVAIRTYGTDHFGSYTSPLPTSYANISATWTENPYTTDDWTWDEVDALEAGVRQYDLGTGTVMTTQVYVEVSYGDIPLMGEVPSGDLFDITLNSAYTGDLALKVYLSNTGDLVKAYDYLNIKLYLGDSVEAGETPDYRLLTLQNGEANFNMQDLTPPPGSGSWTQTSQPDFQGGTLNQVEAISPGDVILDTFADTVTDTFDDESMIASKTNLVVSGGQVQLTGGVPGTATLRPNANGDLTQFEDLIGAPTHWEAVDEEVADDYTTHVGSDMGGMTDLFELTDSGLATGTQIDSITVYERVRREGWGDNDWQIRIVSGATSAYSPIFYNETTTWVYRSYQWTADPNTGEAWTVAAVDALQAGAYVNTGVDVSQVYVEVDYTTPYDSPGTLTSINLLPGEITISIDSFDYTASAIPSGTGLKVQFSQDNTNWYNSSGTPDGWDTLSQGANNIDLSGLSWTGANFYYKMEFTSDGSDTPVLDEISVNFSIYYTSGDLTSSAYDAGDGIVTWDWGTISFTIDEPSATDIQFQIRTAATEGGLSTATWYGPTGTGDYYTTSGTDINSVHDGDRWIQYKAYFSGPGDSTPTLSDVTITYDVAAITYTIEVTSGSYCLVSTDTSGWESGWTVTPEFYCQIVQR